MHCCFSVIRVVFFTSVYWPQTRSVSGCGWWKRRPLRNHLHLRTHRYDIIPQGHQLSVIQSFIEKFYRSLANRRVCTLDSSRHKLIWLCADWHCPLEIACPAWFEVFDSIKSVSKVVLAILSSDTHRVCWLSIASFYLLITRCHV